MCLSEIKSCREFIEREQNVPKDEVKGEEGGGLSSSETLICLPFDHFQRTNWERAVNGLSRILSWLFNKLRKRWCNNNSKSSNNGSSNSINRVLMMNLIESKVDKLLQVIITNCLFLSFSLD